MTGAVCLAGYAALRAGAGLVTLVVPENCLETVAGFNPCYMTVPVADERTGVMAPPAALEVQRLVENATAVGMGPGMSRGEGVRAVVIETYCSYLGHMVIDADALNALATEPAVINGAPGPRILTPHVGEFRRLIGDDSISPESCRSRAKSFAADNDVVVVLKGHRTLVTNGTIDYENTTGNAGMATGGSGDVLTGITTALLGHGYSPFDAAVLAVYVHGLAGDVARDSFGEVSLTALDIADSLPTAFAQVGGRA